MPKFNLNKNLNKKAHNPPLLSSLKSRSSIYCAASKILSFNLRLNYFIKIIKNILIRPQSLLILSLFACTPLYADTIPGNPYGEAWQCQNIKGAWSCTGKLTEINPTQRPTLKTHDEKILEQDQILGWIPDNSDSNNCSLCGGSYYDPYLGNPKDIKPLDSSVSQVLSNQKNYTLGGDVKLNGNVEIIQPGRRVMADHVTLTPSQDNDHQLEKIEAQGHSRIRQTGQMLYGDTLSANLYDYKATLTNAYYLMKVQTDWSNNTNQTQTPENFTGYAHGQALALHQLSQTLFQFDHASYTTAPPDDDTWHLFASKILLNKVTEKGTAENAVIFIQKVPIFYFPYFTFPLSKKRESGFLYGDISNSGSSGLTIAAPYYLNLAPNYDDTATPILLAKRGAMIDNQFRYLTSNTNGILNTTYLPKDQITGTSRWLINYTQSTQLNPFWHMGVNYNDASDANYFTDLENNNAQISNQSYLSREINLTSNYNNFSTGAYIRDYKILDPSLDLDNRPYNTLPELDFSSPSISFANNYLNFGVNSQFTNFQKDDVLDQTPPIEGQRTNLHPTLSLPLTKSYGYFTPSIGTNAIAYSLQNTGANNFPDNNPSMIDPIFDLDTALNFDRSFGFLNNNYEQTLTPRLAYLNIPYINQNNFPVFDSSIIPFSYDSLFNTNRFNGGDRQGDANQLSYSLSTDLRNETGRELFNLGVGQIAYFQDRKVSLCQSSPGNNCLATENPTYDQGFSDIAAETNLWLTQSLKLHYDFTFNQNHPIFDTQNYQIQYMPNPQHIFNLGFSSNRQDYSLLNTEQLLAGTPPPMLAQVTSSFLWQMTPLWNFIGSWNYSTNQKRTIDMFTGLEYSPCSWAVRIIWHRYLLNQDVNDPNELDGHSTQAFAIQFELKGLGNIGDSKIQYLAQQIPGYQPSSGFSL